MILIPWWVLLIAVNVILGIILYLTRKCELDKQYFSEFLFTISMAISILFLLYKFINWCTQNIQII